MKFRISSIVTALMFILFAASLPVYAEGDVVCSGKIMGESDYYGENAGVNYFNAHQSPLLDANTPVDLSVALGAGVFGLAPKYREHAACVSETVAPDEYRMEGWAWNDHLGFISFYCGAENMNPAADHNNNPIDTNDDGVSDTNVSPVSCGAIDYGVTIGVDVAGTRQLSGHAWSDTYGYIEFEDQNTGDAYPYGVTMDSATGELTGWAWTDAGVYLNFTGVVVQLPGAVIPPDDVVCGPPKSACFFPNPSDYSGEKGNPSVNPSLIGDDVVRVADGRDEYNMELYLLEDDGVTPIDTSTVNMVFNWKDTVKLNQLSGQTGDFSDDNTNPAGGVVYKPVKIGAGGESFDSVFEEFDGDGNPTTDPGHYKLKPGKTIRSYAPTSNENTSMTTGTDPLFEVQNETFYSDLRNETIDIELSELKLFNISLEIDGENFPAMFPNKTLGEEGAGLALRFRPAVDIDPLYVDDHRDIISILRGSPNAYKVGRKRYGKLDLGDSDINIDFKLDFSQTESLNNDNIECANPESAIFQFFRSFSGEVLPQGGDFTEQAVTAADLVSPVDISTLMTVDGEGTCKELAGPTLYSEISYTVNGKNVVYYANKLPRLLSKAANPVVVVHGNIYSPEVFSPGVDEDAPSITETGNVDTSAFRNTVYQNVDQILGNELDLTPVDGVAEGGCVIKKLNSINDFVVTAALGKQCVEGTNYGSKLFNRQNILWFKDADVIFDLNKNTSDESLIDKNWSIIVNGGRLFIDNDIYRENPIDLALVVIGPYSAGCAERGNVYIGDTVRNIQANISTDCSVFSYVTGDVRGIGNDGFYEIDPGSRMVDVFGGGQLLIEGSVSSFNTIGGAEPDKNGNIRDGFGIIYDNPTMEERQRAQQFDLNYMRLFSLDVKTQPETGLPYDFNCDKYLTTEDILQIKQWQLHFGDPDVDEYPPVYGEKGVGQGLECDGIDVEKTVEEGGDLVVPMDDAGIRARGLSETDTDPFYIFFRPSNSIFLIER